MQLLHHIRPSGQIHLLAQRTFRIGRNREGHPHGGLQRVYLRHRRPLGQHVRHGRPRHIAVQPVHASLLPAPETLPQSRQQPCPAAGALPAGDGNQGRQESLHRQRYPLRPVRPQRRRGLPARSGRKPHLRQAESSPGAHRRRGTEADAQAVVRTVPRAERTIQRHLPPRRAPLPAHPLFHIEPSGLHRSRHGTPLGNHALARLPAGAGTGPYSHPHDAQFRDVLYGERPLHGTSPLRGEKPGRKAPPKELLLP